MNNDSNAVRGRHLEALAGVFLGKLTSVSGAINDILNSFGVFQGATSVRAGTEGLVPAPVAGDEVKFLCGDGTWSTVESGATVLDTVPASVNGGMWYEVVNDMPVVKIYYNGQEYSLGEAEDPNLQVIPSNVTVPHGNVITASVSYDGDGILSLQSTIDGAFYDSDTRQITVPYSPSIDSSSIRVKLAGCPGFTPAEASLNVTMEKLNPNLTVTPSSLNIAVSTSSIATVDYSGSGTVSLSGSNATLTSALIYSDRTITVPYVTGVGEATVNVNLSASPGYTADQKTLVVTMAKLEPHLTITPSSVKVPYRGSTVIQAAYDGDGTLHISGNGVQTEYDETTKTITIYHSSIQSPHTITVELDATDEYAADSATFDVIMGMPQTSLSVVPSASVTRGSDITATVSCNSGGTISAVCDNSDIEMTFDGTTITLPFHLFSTNTVVTVTVSVAANGDYPSAEKQFTVTYMGGENFDSVRYRVVDMPFNTSATEDLCGNTWRDAYGDVNNPTVTIENNAAYFNGNPFDYLIKEGGFTGAWESRIITNFWVNMTPTPDARPIFAMAQTQGSSNGNNPKNALVIQTTPNGASGYGISVVIFNDSGQVDTYYVPCSASTWHYFDMYYRCTKASSGNYPFLYISIDGTEAVHLDRTAREIDPFWGATFPYVYIGNGAINSMSAPKFIGYIDDFRISAIDAAYGRTPPPRSA